MSRSRNLLIVGLLLIVMALWGGSFIAIKIALRYLTPLELVIARFVPSAILLLPMGLWAAHHRGSAKPRYWNMPRKERLLAILASFLAAPAYHTCLNIGETMIPAGWASLVIALNPACILILAGIFLHEKVGLARMQGVVLALGGLLFIALTHEVAGSDGHHLSMAQKLLGLLITLGAVVSWGGFTVISKRLMVGREPLENLGWTMTLGALWTAPFWRLDLIQKIADAPFELTGALLFLSVGCTVFAFAIWFWVLSQWPAGRAGVFIYLNPLVALGVAHLLLAETLDIRTIMGAGLVLAGVLIAVRDKPVKAT